MMVRKQSFVAGALWLLSQSQSSDAFMGLSSSTPTAVRSPVTLASVFSSTPQTLFVDDDADDEDFAIDNRHAASDWFYNVKSIPQSRVLREIRSPLAAVFIWSIAVSAVHRICTMSSWTVLKTFGTHMSIPTSAHSFLVSSLGLLLVFRTNSAYQRFNEGRKIWENILSVSRNLSRFTRMYGPEIGMDRKVRLGNLIAAFPYLLRHHIRRGCLCETKPIEDDHRMVLEDPVKALETRFEGDNLLQGAQSRTKCYVDRRSLPWCLFDKDSVSRLARTQNRPLWVCDRIGREVMDIPYGDNFSSRERLAMLQAVDKLTNAIGECERIHQTAVPLNYARHSLRSLTLFLFTLPFCLVDKMGLFTAPVTACIAWLYFGVYQIGYSIEDPFQGSLRLSNLCDAIRRDVVGSVAENMEDSIGRMDLWSAGIGATELSLQSKKFIRTTGLFGKVTPNSTKVTPNSTANL